MLDFSANVFLVVVVTLFSFLHTRWPLQSTKAFLVYSGKSNSHQSLILNLMNDIIVLFLTESDMYEP